MKFPAKFRLASAVLVTTTLFIAVHGLWQSNDREKFFRNGLENVDQNYESKGWETLIKARKQPYHKLTEADFQVNDMVASVSKVMTNSFIYYEYRYRIVGNGKNSLKALISSFKVRSGFDASESWRRSSFKDPSVYLEHEQGHADINELESRIFAAKIAESKPEGIGATADSAARDLDEKIKAVYEEVAKDNRRWQTAYDLETYTGLDTKAQKTATAALAVNLQEAGITDNWTGRGTHSTANQSEVIF